MLEKYETVVAMYHGFDYISLLTSKPETRLEGVAAAMEHILSLEDGKRRYLLVLNFVICDRENLLKHTDHEVRALAKRFPKDSGNGRRKQ